VVKVERQVKPTAVEEEEGVLSRLRAYQINSFPMADGYGSLVAVVTVLALSPAAPLTWRNLTATIPTHRHDEIFTCRIHTPIMLEY